MAADHEPGSPLGQTVGSTEPTLLDLAIDDSWGAMDGALPGTADHDVAVDGIHTRPHWWPPNWFRRKETAALRLDEIDQLADESTDLIDLTPDPFWKTALKTVGAFTGSAVVAYLILTFPSQWVKVVYAVEHFGRAEAPATIVKTNATDGTFQDVVVPSLSFRPPNSAAPTQSPPTSPFATLGENQLVIPKIDVSAPIVWDSSFDEKIMLENLQKGVVHYGGTDLPNPTTGNVFITGHSSYYWWDPGQYKTVFAVLDQLKNGDQIALTYQSRVYVYQVYESIVVKPSQTDVLDTSAKPILSLMTCTPVGTSLNRLIVRADLVGVFDQVESGKTATTPSDSAPAQPAADAITPAQPTSPPPSAPGQTLDELPGLDSWLGR